MITKLLDRGLVPDFLIQNGIRRLLRQRLAEIAGTDLHAFKNSMKHSTLAVETQAANQQHYEVPTEFYDACLGARKKYSSCYFIDGNTTLDQAEEAMLQISCDRAQLSDGQKILELGCGWGAITLWMAEKYPGSEITAVSNSKTQKIYIDDMAAKRNLKNITVITADINQFVTDKKFDRVMSVEMFEHVRNHEQLFSKISSWLEPAGKLFFHIFCHREKPYFFENQGDGDWMTKHFFAGGLMPSWSLPLMFQDDLTIQNYWKVCGTQYEQTSLAWLENLDRNKSLALSALKHHPDGANVMFQRWRIFFLACAETFGFKRGGEWFVGHYLFSKRQ